MSDSNPASGMVGRKRPRFSGRGVALLAGGALVLVVALIITVAEHRGDSGRSAGGPAGNQLAARPAPPPPQAGAPARDAAAAPAREAAAAPRPGPDKPSFDIVHIGPDGGAVIAGRAAPDAEVTVKDGARELGRTKTDEHGEWVLLPDKPLQAGPQELTLSAREPQDAKPVPGDGPVVLTVPERGRKSGPLALPALAVLTPESGAPRVLQAPPGPAPAAGQKSGRLGMDAVEYDQNGNLRFGGAAKPGASVRVYVDNKPAGDARADAQGRWALAPDAAVSPGRHQLRVDQLDANGKVVGRVELPFQRVQLSAAEVGPGRIVVQPGQNLWRIARQTYGRGIHYTVIYSANLDQIRDPAKIYPGQAFALPSSVGPAANEAGAAAPSSSIRSR